MKNKQYNLRANKTVYHDDPKSTPYTNEYHMQSCEAAGINFTQKTQNLSINAYYHTATATVLFFPDIANKL